MVTPHQTRTAMYDQERDLLLSLAQCPEAAINVTGEFATYVPSKDEISGIEVTKTMLMHDVRLIKYSLQERRDAVKGLKYLGLIVAGSTPDEDAWLTAKGLATARQLLGVEVAAPAAQTAPQPSSPAAASPAPSKSPAPVAAKAPATSGGVVISVAPNPKRAGSASAARYDLWKVGMTAEAALEAGLSKADIAHDTKKGFVVFG